MTDPRSGRRYKTFRATIRAVHAHQNRPCALCGKAIDYRLQYPHPAAWSLDHRVPIHRGGATFDPNNVDAACLRCNLSRGARESNAKRRLSKAQAPRHTSWRW